MSQQVIIAIATCPDETVAQRIAATLVSEKLAACVNRMAAVRSTYIWDGRLQEDAEILLMMKTTADRVAALESRLKELHPYEIPELLTVSVAGGNERYLEWVRMGTGGR
ncbi:MAG TPA: divalent-cation tolerance protein CutA [Steroidobacteraceae bacterium]